MKRLLVVGASGLLGSAALDIGHNIYEVYGTALHNFDNGLIKLDVTDTKAVSTVVDKIKPDLVLDTHGLNNVDYCELHKEETWNTNVIGAMNVARAAQEVGAKYIFISSDYIYDGGKSIYSETDKPEPLNYLGRGKWAVEALLDIFESDYLIAITSGLYGKRSSTGKKSFIQFIVEKLGHGEIVDVIADQYSSPTFVEDVVNSLFALASKNERGIFNIVGSDCITKYELALRICGEFGLNKKLVKACKTSDLPQPQEAKRPIKVMLSTKKLEDSIGTVPRGIGAGLKMVHN